MTYHFAAVPSGAESYRFARFPLPGNFSINCYAPVAGSGDTQIKHMSVLRWQYRRTDPLHPHTVISRTAGIRAVPRTAQLLHRNPSAEVGQDMIAQKGVQHL